MTVSLPSITFFFPYYEVSGLPVLFLRMAEYLADSMEYETYIIDYIDGYMSRNRSHGSCVEIRQFKNGVPINIPADTILVLQSVLPNTMRPELQISKKTRVVFWTLHPMNLIQTIVPLPYFRHLQSRHLLFQHLGTRLLHSVQHRSLQNFLISLHKKKSLFFMDGSTLRSTSERLHLNFPDPIFIPVLSDNATTNLKLESNYFPSGNLNICWIGRLADFKIHILVYTIRMLKNYAAQEQLPITMHIIGEGPEAHQLDQFREGSKCFQLNELGIKAKHDLDRYLLESVDILMAMGTSALEGAKLGVPTILLDMSYGPITKGYKYKWLYEAETYSLGDVINDEHFTKSNRSIDGIIEAVLDNYGDLSSKTFYYYQSHHSMQAVSKKFVAALQQASFQYGDFESEVFKKGIIRYIYEALRKRFSYTSVKSIT